MNQIRHFDVIVIGAGPAGLTAGIYLSRARIKTLILNEGTVGGQMILTHEIANYPGVESISGYQLASIMKKQASSFGCEFRSNINIERLQLSSELKIIHLADGSIYSANSVILTPGGRSRTLGMPGELDFKGRGISYCATCDGDFFTEKDILVVGGGNSALEEAVSLTKYASHVTLIHQFDHFQAFEYAIEDARSNRKISYIMESRITGFYGTDTLKEVDIENLKSGKVKRITTDGVFIFIGYLPNTEFLKGLIALNKRDEILVNNDMSTNIPGIFAAGDSIAKKFRQVTTAVGDGTIAALAAANYIHELKSKKQPSFN